MVKMTAKKKIIINSKTYKYPKEETCLTEVSFLSNTHFNLKSAGMFVTIIQNVRQHWCSAEKSNAGVSLDTVSRFFRALPIMTCSLDLQ